MPRVRLRVTISSCIIRLQVNLCEDLIFFNFITHFFSENTPQKSRIDYWSMMDVNGEVAPWQQDPYDNYLENELLGLDHEYTEDFIQ